MDMIAQDLGMDPIEFRLKNITEPNMVTVNKMILTTNGLRECIRKSSRRSLRVEQKTRQATTFETRHRYRYCRRRHGF